MSCEAPFDFGKQGYVAPWTLQEKDKEKKEKKEKKKHKKDKHKEGTPAGPEDDDRGPRPLPYDHDDRGEYGRRPGPSVRDMDWERDGPGPRGPPRGLGGPHDSGDEGRPGPPPRYGGPPRGYYPGGDDRAGPRGRPGYGDGGSYGEGGRGRGGRCAMGRWVDSLAQAGRASMGGVEGWSWVGSIHPSLVDVGRYLTASHRAPAPSRMLRYISQV